MPICRYAEPFGSASELSSTSAAEMTASPAALYGAGLGGLREAATGIEERSYIQAAPWLGYTAAA